MKLHTITFGLLIIGGLNWLLEAFHYGLAEWGIPWSVLMIVYLLVGASAIYEIVTHKTRCKNCEAGNMQKPM